MRAEREGESLRVCGERVLAAEEEEAKEEGEGRLAESGTDASREKWRGVWEEKSEEEVMEEEEEMDTEGGENGEEE